MTDHRNTRDRLALLTGLVVLTVCLQVISLGWSAINEIRLQRAMDAVERFADNLRDL